MSKEQLSESSDDYLAWSKNNKNEIILKNLEVRRIKLIGFH